MAVEPILALALESNVYYLDALAASAGVSSRAAGQPEGKPKLSYEELRQLLINLGVSRTKFLILRLLRRSELLRLLPFLDSEQLTNALHLFPKERLMQFFQLLPKDVMLKLLLQAIPLKRFLQLFQTSLIFNILRSKRLTVHGLVKQLDNWDVGLLRELMQHITGQPADGKSKPDLMRMFYEMDKIQLLNGLKLMGQKPLLELIYHTAKQDPELLMMLPKGALLNVADNFPKPSLLALFEKLEPGILIQFVAQLPDVPLAMALTQLPDDVFIDLMLSQYPDVIASLAA